MARTSKVSYRRGWAVLDRASRTAQLSVQRGYIGDPEKEPTRGQTLSGAGMQHGSSGGHGRGHGRQKIRR